MSARFAHVDDDNAREVSTTENGDDDGEDVEEGRQDEVLEENKEEHGAGDECALVCCVASASVAAFAQPRDVHAPWKRM